MEDFLTGLEEALGGSSIPNSTERKQVHFNSKIIVNHTSYLSESLNSVTDSIMMGLSNLDDDDNEEEEDEDGQGVSQGEIVAFLESAKPNSNDRLFISDPPSSLFDVSGLTKSALSIQNDEYPSSLSEMITPMDSSLAKVAEAPKSSPKPSTRLLKFDWQKTRQESSSANADPFVEDIPVATSPNTFVIKSPFKPSFKSFLSSELQADEEDGAQSEHSDGDETIRTREDEVTEKQVLLDRSDNCSWLGDENPLELYNQAHSFQGGGSLIQDDFYELKKEMDQQFSLDEGEVFNNNILEVQSQNDDVSLISNASFLPETRMDQPVDLDASADQHQTPHNVRTMQSLSEELFSPGSFFASRSGQLGDLESKEHGTRPIWYTPKHDAQGRLIDPIGVTPAERPEKHNDHNGLAGKSEQVRKPLYVPAPPLYRKTISIPAVSGHDDMVERDTPFDYSVALPQSTPTDLDENQKVQPLLASVTKEIDPESTIDPFDWQNALELTIPDTTVADDDNSKANISLCNTSSTSINNQRRSPVQINLLESASSLSCRLESAMKSSQRIIIELVNVGTKPICFTFNQVGSCSLTRNGSTDVVADSIFRTESSKGKVEPKSSKQFKFRFFPIQKGLYRSLFHLKSNSRVISVLFEGQSGTEELLPTKVSKPLSHSSMSTNRSNHVVDSKLSLEELIDFDLCTKKDVVEQQEVLEAKTPIASRFSQEQQQNYPLSTTTPKIVTEKKDVKRQPSSRKSLYSTPKAVVSFKSLSMIPTSGKKLATPRLVRHKLDFGRVAVGQTRTLHLRICNPDEKATVISFAVTGRDFMIPIKELSMTPRSFLILPICFAPHPTSVSSSPLTPVKTFDNKSSVRNVDERLVLKKDGLNATIRLGLVGEVVCLSQ